MTDMTLTIMAAVLAALAGGVFGWLLTKMTFAQKIAALEHDNDQAEDALAATKKGLREQEGKAEALRNEKHQLDVETSVLRQQINDLKSRTAELLQRLGKTEDQLTDERRLSAQLDHDYTELKTTLTQREQHFREQFASLDETKKSLSREFENIANKIFEEKGKTFTTTSKTSLDDMLKPFREQIEGFQKRINEVHDASIRGNADLNAEIKKVLEIGLQMSAEATNLTTALKGDSQQRGAWGEAQLRRTLEMSGLVEKAHFEVQSAFRDEEGRRKQTDYLIRLPDNKHIIIDSKVSLNAYDRVCSAETPEAQVRAMDDHIMAVRRHIDDLASKDYTNLAGIRSPSFVLMFMPVEAAYIEALKTNKGLFEYGYSKGIVLVSHTTLIPILRTVSNLWMIERSNSEAREISERAGEIFNNVCLVAERLSKLGGTLTTASNQYNQTVTALVGNQGLYGKVERFGTLSEKVNKELPKLELAHRDFEHERMALIVEALDEPDVEIVTVGSNNPLSDTTLSGSTGA
ncbi:DNA recombination protein RmuC [Yokenella regensburgei]|uniref:DNA recombination protein RmuC n=2 Tax=Yokenella regensburgei TaxID=158877 RepID=UPI003F5CCE26